jgi:hypothetical protein
VVKNEGCDVIIDVIETAIIETILRSAMFQWASRTIRDLRNANKLV